MAFGLLQQNAAYRRAWEKGRRQKAEIKICLLISAF